MDGDAQQIDWSTAKVTDRTLSVRLVERPAKRWREDFQGVLSLLAGEGQRGWGAIKLSKAHIEVADVAEGSEADLRHLLESAVLQANSDVEADSARASPDATGAPETPDRRMTATFRRFGLPMA